MRGLMLPAIPLNPSLLFVLVPLLGLADAALAQTVYESKSGQGKVYSDRPMPGSKPVELKPLNVMDPPSPSATVTPSVGIDTAAKKMEVSAPSYKQLLIVFPETGGSVAANNATFEVRVSIDPPLQINKGHAFVLRMDGRNIPGRYTATEMMIPPEFFGDVAPAGVQRHVLEASVIDAQGVVIMSSVPVDFQTRFVTILQNPHYRPRPLPLPGVKPAPKPLPEVLPGGVQGSTQGSGTRSQPAIEMRR